LDGIEEILGLCELEGRTAAIPVGSRLSTKV
jgi:hypothetical protein